MPSWPRRLWDAWRSFGRRVGRVNGAVILGLTYLIVLTPYAFILRLAKRDLLDSAIDHERSSYWERRTLPKPGAYLRPF